MFRFDSGENLNAKRLCAVLDECIRITYIICKCIIYVYMHTFDLHIGMYINGHVHICAHLYAYQYQFIARSSTNTSKFVLTNLSDCFEQTNFDYFVISLKFKIYIFYCKPLMMVHNSVYVAMVND